MTFAGGSYLSKVETSNPPIKIARFRNGSYRRKKDGGYILAGKSSDRTVHADWQEMVAPSDVGILLAGQSCQCDQLHADGHAVPICIFSYLQAECAGNVSTCGTLYLAARKYNGSWLAHVGATLNSQISVPATAGYTQFAVRLINPCRTQRME